MNIVFFLWWCPFDSKVWVGSIFWCFFACKISKVPQLHSWLALLGWSKKVFGSTPVFFFFLEVLWFPPTNPKHLFLVGLSGDSKLVVGVVSIDLLALQVLGWSGFKPQFSVFASFPVVQFHPDFYLGVAAWPDISVTAVHWLLHWLGGLGKYQPQNNKQTKSYRQLTVFYSPILVFSVLLLDGPVQPSLLHIGV